MAQAQGCWKPSWCVTALWWAWAVAMLASALDSLNPRTTLSAHAAKFQCLSEARPQHPELSVPSCSCLRKFLEIRVSHSEASESRRWSATPSSASPLTSRFSPRRSPSCARTWPGTSGALGHQAGNSGWARLGIQVKAGTGRGTWICVYACMFYTYIYIYINQYKKLHIYIHVSLFVRK